MAFKVLFPLQRSSRHVLVYACNLLELRGGIEAQINKNKWGSGRTEILWFIRSPLKILNLQ